MKINILGTDYEIRNMETGDMSENDADGICQTYSKVIEIRYPTDMLEDKDTIRDRVERWREVMRHEIIHAYFTESGMGAGDEMIVEWMAAQIPKMLKSFEKTKCI